MNNQWTVGSFKESGGRREEASCRGQGTAGPLWTTHPWACTWPQRRDEGVWGWRGCSGGKASLSGEPRWDRLTVAKFLKPAHECRGRNQACSWKAAGGQPHPGAPPPEVPACWGRGVGWGTREHTSRVPLLSVWGQGRSFPGLRCEPVLLAGRAKDGELRPQGDPQPVGTVGGGEMPSPPLACLGQLCRVPRLVSQRGPGGPTSNKSPCLPSSPVLAGTVPQITCLRADPCVRVCREESRPRAFSLHTRVSWVPWGN